MRSEPKGSSQHLNSCQLTKWDSIHAKPYNYLLRTYARSRANRQREHQSHRHTGSKCLYCSDFRRVSLSFHSTLHLSLTVLVHYRTREDIELQEKYTSQFALPSQGTRLCEYGPYDGITRAEQDSHLPSCLFQKTYTRGPSGHTSR